MKLFRFNNVPCSAQAEAIIAKLRQSLPFKHFLFINNYGQPLGRLQWDAMGRMMNLSGIQCRAKYWRLMAGLLRSRQATVQDLRGSRPSAAISAAAAPAASMKVVPLNSSRTITTPPWALFSASTTDIATPGLLAGCRTSGSSSGVRAPIQAPGDRQTTSTPAAGSAERNTAAVEFGIPNIHALFSAASAASRSQHPPGAYTGNNSSSTVTAAHAHTQLHADVDAAVFSHFAEYIAAPQASFPETIDAAAKDVRSP